MLDKSRVLGYRIRIGRDASRVSADSLTVVTDYYIISDKQVWVHIYSLSVLSDTHNVGVDFELVWLNCLTLVTQSPIVIVNFIRVNKDIGLIFLDGL